ncbi:MAG: hypothetical protein R3F37_13775 [Candidatus Competibacteraceae bacterium]
MKSRPHWLHNRRAKTRVQHHFVGDGDVDHDINIVAFQKAYRLGSVAGKPSK